MLEVHANKLTSVQAGKPANMKIGKKRHATADPDTPVGPKFNEFFQGVT